MTPREVAKALAQILVEEANMPTAELEACTQGFLEKGSYTFHGDYNFHGLLNRDDNGTPWLTYAPGAIGNVERNKIVLKTNHRFQAYFPPLLELYNSEAVILNVGCGWLRFLKTFRAKKEITLDKNPLVKPDIVHDLEQYPWPVEDDSIDLVVAMDILEHVDQVIEAVEESWRVLKLGGTLIVRTGTFNEQGFTDPTHKHWFSLDSFDYFDPSTFMGKSYGFYSNCKFKITVKGKSGQELVFHLRKQPYAESVHPPIEHVEPHILVPISEQHK